MSSFIHALAPLLKKSYRMALYNIQRAIRDPLEPSNGLVLTRAVAHVNLVQGRGLKAIVQGDRTGKAAAQLGSHKEDLTAFILAEIIASKCMCMLL